MTPQPPETLDDLNNKIKQGSPSLSKRLRQVADYVLEAPREVAFGTVATLSKAAQVHPSTWVRFANAFGFSGFSEMQGVFKQNLLSQTSNYQERVRLVRDEWPSGDAEDSAHQILSQFCEENARSLEQLAESISKDDLTTTINLLQQALSVHIVGVRRAFSVATYFAYGLRHIERKAYLIDGMAGMFEEQAAALDKNDVLIVVSFAPYGEETLKVAKLAAQKEVPLIVLSDSHSNPLASMARVNFVVRDAQVQSFRGLSSSLCLAQAIIIGLAHELEKKNASG